MYGKRAVFIKYRIDEVGFFLLGHLATIIMKNCNNNNNNRKYIFMQLKINDRFLKSLLLFSKVCLCTARDMIRVDKYTNN